MKETKKLSVGTAKGRPMSVVMISREGYYTASFDTTGSPYKIMRGYGTSSKEALIDLLRVANVYEVSTA